MPGFEQPVLAERVQSGAEEEGHILQRFVGKPMAKHGVRRWLQFSLRTLLIVIALGAGLAFAWAKCIEPYRLQREAMTVITALGGSFKTEDATGWITYLDNNAQDVVVVDLANCDEPNEYLPHLGRLPRLRSLVVGGRQFGDEQVAALERLTNLRGLVLDSTVVSDEEIDGLKQSHPDLAVYKSERRAVNAINALHLPLNDLDLGLSDTDQDQSASPILTPPEWLRSEVGDAYFAETTEVVNWYYYRVTDDALTWMTTLEHLRALYPPDTGRDASFLAKMRATHSLERVRLSGRKITDGDLAHLRRFPNLSWVDVSNTSMTDAGLAHVATLGRLEGLQMSGTGVTDAGLSQIAGLSHLQKVIAYTTAIGDEGLKILAGMPSLRSLNMSETLVTDDGLRYLERNTALTFLQLSGTKITDLGIAHLQKCTHLKFLGIHQTGMSAAGRKSLHTALPYCHIED